MRWLRFFQQADNKLAVDLSLILGVSFVLILALRFLFRFLKRRSSMPGWMMRFVDSLQVFAPLGILSYASLLCLETTVRSYKLLAGDYFREGRIALGIVIGAWILFRWKKAFEQGLVEKLSKEGATRELTVTLVLSRLISVALIVVIGLIVLDMLKVKLTALYAFGGLGGVALSLAGKEILANFLSGFMIYATRPFTVGETIRSSNKGFEGVVEEIGWTATKLKNPDHQPTFIPNFVFNDALIDNPSRISNRKIKVILCLPYRDIDKIEAIVQKSNSYIMHHKFVDPLSVNYLRFIKFGNSALELELCVYLRITVLEEFLKAQEEFLLHMNRIFTQCGSSIIPPYREFFGIPAASVGKV